MTHQQLALLREWIRAEITAVARANQPPSIDNYSVRNYSEIHHADLLFERLCAALESK